MEHSPYISPTTRILPVLYAALLCQIGASTPRGQEGGDYDWED